MVIHRVCVGILEGLCPVQGYYCTTSENQMEHDMETQILM